VTAVFAVTALVVTLNVALAGTPAAGLPLVSATKAPPVGAAAVSVAVPVEALPPTTLVGLTDKPDKLAGALAACGVKRLVAENGPNTPAEFCARTRHHRRCAGRPPMVACEAMIPAWFTLKGAAIVDVSSI
jgi:hypothetical protein